MCFLLLTNNRVVRVMFSKFILRVQSKRQTLLVVYTIQHVRESTADRVESVVTCPPVLMPEGALLLEAGGAVASSLVSRPC